MMIDEIERLGAVYVLRANWLFQLLLSMVSTILDQSTISKVFLTNE